MYYVYIIRSFKNNRYYTGITSDLDKRLLAHNNGRNYSTKSGRPWKIIYKENFHSKKKAWHREKQIKKYKHGEAFKKLINHSGVD